MEHLDRHGVQTFEAAVDLVRALRAQAVRTAVVTSSINCESVLTAGGNHRLIRRARRWTRYHAPRIARQASTGRVP